MSDFVDGSLDGCPHTEYDFPPYMPGRLTFSGYSKFYPKAKDVLVLEESCICKL